VTISEACARFGVTKSAVGKVRKTLPTLPLEELTLAALTENGTIVEGVLTTHVLETLAAWIDHINHDGCTPGDVRGLLGRLNQDVFFIENDTWRLLQPWP
jgi:hypothetical protein